jgi:DNA-binding NtrC family response regulator
MDAKPISVLLIEDNDDDVVLIQRFLSDAGQVQYDVRNADRLGKGLEALRGGVFDVVLLDLNLPDAAGLGTFEQVNTQAPDVPIIVLTGYDDDALAVAAVQKGAQDYLVKGQFTAALLGRSIRYAIERRKLLARLEQALKEVKTLRGLLPICSHCKKIRNDSGYWTQIETYILDRTDAEFTHGICPECADTHYGRFLDGNR